MTLTIVFILLSLFLASYLLGGIPCGFIIGKINGLDIRKHGSCNVGATNTLRVCGKKWGMLCFGLDFLKGFLPVLGITLLISSGDFPQQQYFPVMVMTGVILGHIWCPYLKFKGGKGAATAAGAVCAISHWALLISLIIWLGVFYFTRYVSLASVMAVLVFPFTVLFLENQRPAPSTAITTPILITIFIFAAIVILKHKSNIQRLLNGTENKFTRKHKIIHENSCSQ